MSAISDGLRQRFAALGRSHPALWSWLRRVRGKSKLPAAFETPDIRFQPDYGEWMRIHALSRAALCRPVREGQFSILTTVYDTPPVLLMQAAASLFAQAAPTFEWILLDNGSKKPETIEAVRALSRDRRVQYRRVEQNLGIMGGIAACLRQASGEYVVPLDSDDALLPDALQLLSGAAGAGANDGRMPGLIYSDEDLLIENHAQAPFLRPDWDPALNLCSSYVWHLCAIQRSRAVELGAYTDPEATWCHDWDTVFRFHDAGERIAHLRCVLYHWRQHPQSSTNRPDPESGSMRSQKHLLQRAIDRTKRPELFEIIQSSIFRGAPEWQVRRKPVEPEALDLILIKTPGGDPDAWMKQVLAAAHFPFRRVVSADGIAGLREALEDGAWSVICQEQIMPEGDGWPWEILGLRTLHPDTGIVAGRILNPHRVILGGSEIFGFEGIVGCPDYARPENDHGYWCMASKVHSVSAPHPAFFAAEPALLRAALAGRPAEGAFSFFGAWLGAAAAVLARRVVFSPFVTGAAEPGFELSRAGTPAEESDFRARYPQLLPDPRYYSPHFGRTRATAFKLEALAGGDGLLGLGNLSEGSGTR